MTQAQDGLQLLVVQNGQTITRTVSPLAAAEKRAATTIHRDGWGGGYGEPPPRSATATPLQYVQSEAVNSAVDVFAQRVASTPLILYERQANGELEEIKDHPGLDLLQDPNEFLTRSELFWHLTADNLLSGNSYWFLAGPERGQPTEIWRCPPRTTRLVRDREEYISGYITEIEGLVVPLFRDEVIHFKRPNPFDEFYGLSKLATAALAAYTGREMAQWNRAMFGQNYAVPAGIVSIEGNVHDADYDRMKRDWRRSHGGGQRRTAFIRGGKAQFSPVGLSQKDVDFLVGAKWEAEKIFRVFGAYHLLPAEYADDRKINERLFLEENAWPLLVYLAEVLTDKFFTFWGPKRGTGKLIAQFEDIRPRERALDLDEQREQARVQKVNEYRAVLGLEPVDGGDEVMVVHMEQGEKLKFERDAQPDPAPMPPQLQAPPEDDADRESAQPEDAQERAERQESANEDTGDDVGGRFDRAAELFFPDAIHRELSQWERFLVKRWEDAEAIRPFETKAIPPYIASMVQNGVDRCDDVDEVKATFARLHALVDGDMPASAKASFGGPEGTVVLYLSDVEDVLLMQQIFQREVEPDAPVRWTPREHLHVTALHSPMVDHAPFRDIFQEMTYPGFAITATRISSFDTDGDAVPIVALVEPSPELREWQAELHAAFAVRGIPISPYSQPEAWTPHITLGYVEKDYGFQMGLNDIPADITCQAVEMAFTRGDYENVYARVAAPTSVALEGPSGGSYTEASMKAIQATRLLFEGDYDDLLSAYRAGDINRRTWATRMRTLLQRYGRLAFRDGLIDGGYNISPTSPLGDDDAATVNQLLAEQSQYVTSLGAVLKEGEISDTQARMKPAMWWNKSVKPFYDAGRLSADKNGLYLWLLNPLKQNCPTCIAAAGQVHRLRDWYRKNLIPQSDDLLCRGFNCGCQLQRTSGRTIGRLGRIPMYAGKTHDHDDGEPSGDWHVPSLADHIQYEFKRVLGRRIVGFTELTSRRPDGKAEYVVRLREDEGYYRTVSETDAQFGLSMLNDGLRLTTWTMPNDTDAVMSFVVED